MLRENFIRMQLRLFKPFAAAMSLKTAREGQDKLGLLMTSLQKKKVINQNIHFDSFEGALITPKDILRDGILLYLHGGGYTCGDLAYAKGFGATLAARLGIRVLCPAYRLAPEAPFPAAVEDALAAYRYLLAEGYPPSEILVCGESAGGGLVFSLCLKLREIGLAMPAGIIAISPWTDLTLSGSTYAANADADPSLTRSRLRFFADCYIHGTPNGISDNNLDQEMKKNPLASPLFGDLSRLPPTLILAGGDEILLDDTRRMQGALRAAGGVSRIIVREGMWHSYLLYPIRSSQKDFKEIERFLTENLPQPKKLRWIKLDNAAKIYPAIKTKRWNNYFRLSATLRHPVDRDVLQSALDVVVRRFPSIAVRIRRGLFWYYLEEIPFAPKILPESSYPLVHTPFDDIQKCAFRVILYENRISVEFFHAITDGNGGLVFLKTLVAEYLTQKYGVHIPTGDGVLDRLESPRDGEMTDSFLKYSGKVGASRRESNAFHFTGTLEKDGFCTNTTFMMDAASVAAKAKAYGVTVTALLTAVMIQTTADVQAQRVENPLRRKDIKILLPVNLRKLFPSETLRNFVLYVTPGVDARLGEYTFEELCRIIHHQMQLMITKKQMQRRISANVNMEKHLLIKATPLFIKNLFLKMGFSLVGERKSCFTFSNLGIAHLPDPMGDYVSRMDFVLGVQSTTPYNVAAITYGGKLQVNFIRNIREPVLEYHFWQSLRGLGIRAKVESNQR